MVSQHLSDDLGRAFNGDVRYLNSRNASGCRCGSLADLSGVAGPVPAGEALPGDRDVGVDAQGAGQDRGGDLGGELE